MVTQDEDVVRGKKDNRRLSVTVVRPLKTYVVRRQCSSPHKNVCSSYIIYKFKPENILLWYSAVLQSYITFAKVLMENIRKVEIWVLIF